MLFALLTEGMDGQGRDRAYAELSMPVGVTAESQQRGAAALAGALFGP